MNPMTEEVTDMAEFALLAQAEAPGGLLLWGIVALLAGILVLVMPRILNYVVAGYLILIGILQIVAAL